MSAFDTAFTQLIGLEGNYSNDEHDPGNWTSGKVGVGKLNGTMYGISAAAYPTLDIAGLSLVKAKSIYLSDFWDACKCDAFPDVIGAALFKESVNMGKAGAVKALQRSLKLADDGVVGNLTIGKATAQPPQEVLERFLTECAYTYVGMDNFKADGHGWLYRVIRTAVESNVVA